VDFQKIPIHTVRVASAAPVQQDAFDAREGVPCVRQERVDAVEFFVVNLFEAGKEERRGDGAFCVAFRETVQVKVEFDFDGRFVYRRLGVVQNSPLHFIFFCSF
jgi:hypothetical protein